MVEDPEWPRDVPPEHPEVLRRLEAVACGLPAFRAAPASHRDPELMERLRAIGYIN